VGEEVRKLTEASQPAAATISGIVREIQDEIQDGLALPRSNRWPPSWAASGTLAFDKSVRRPEGASPA
jgi:hypothetical protein